MKLTIKNLAILTLAILTLNPSQGLALTSKQKSFAMIAGCAVGGGVAGDQLGKAQGNPNYNQTATMFSSALLTGLLCMAYDLAFDPFPSQENEYAKELASLRAINKKLELAVTEQALGTNTKKFDLYDHMELQESMVGDDSFNKMVNSNYKYKGLELGGKKLRGKKVYIPVSKNVIMEGFNYYIVYPKKRGVGTNPCVTPLAGSEYLDKKTPGLGDALFIEGRKQINKKIRQRKKGI